MPSDAIVVGGGVAGLVAARRLALEGLGATVLERTGRLGGQVARQRVGGVDLDAAAESFATRGGAVAALLAELGLGQDIVYPRADPAWLHRADGTAVPLPATGLLGIPGDPLASDVVRAIGRAAAERASLDASLPASEGADASSLGELVRLRMGAAVVDGLVAPVVRGVHSSTPDDLAVERAHPRLREELVRRGSLAAAVLALRAASPAGSAVAGIRGGMFRLVDALEADCARLGVTFELDAAVDDVGLDRVTVAGEVRHGIVVRASGAADPVDDRMVTLVTLVLDAPSLDRAPRGTGILVSADAPGVRARALTHLTAKWDWIAEAFPGRHAVRLSYDGTPDNPIETATRDAGILLAAPLEHVVDANVHRWVRGSAAHASDVAAVGESVSGTGLASVVPHAERIARDISASSRIGRGPRSRARMEG
ncbi:FAD-dependent oxidoreductase [Microbacterium sp. NPDC019599]|uniref:protoporphyrinogen/coproporphyrinogen oxidase n=1 Tax=Microbacterium sp. NPDC019599 TaxID=3154690 RepID=UPI003403EFE9